MNWSRGGLCLFLSSPPSRSKSEWCVSRTSYHRSHVRSSFAEDVDGVTTELPVGRNKAQTLRHWSERPITGSPRNSLAPSLLHPLTSLSFRYACAPISRSPFVLSRCRHTASQGTRLFPSNAYHPDRRMCTSGFSIRSLFRDNNLIRQHARPDATSWTRSYSRSIRGKLVNNRMTGFTE